MQVVEVGQEPVHVHVHYFDAFSLHLIFQHVLHVSLKSFRFLHLQLNSIMHYIRCFELLHYFDEFSLHAKLQHELHILAK